MAGHYQSIPVDEDNPSASPVMGLDISKEIQSYLQKLQTLAFATYLGLVLCLSWNLMAVTTMWIQGCDETINLFLAIGFLVIGVAGAYVSWYRALCQGLSTENASMLNRFFLFFQLHISFCMFAAVAPPVIYKGRFLTGILSAIEVSDGDGLAWIFYFIGFGLFCSESMFSIWVMQQVFQYYRGSGFPMEKIIATTRYSIAVTSICCAMFILIFCLLVI